MKRAPALLLTVGAALTLAAAGPATAPSAVRMIDDFEGYTDGQAIATGAQTKPWGRFGMVDDNLYATADAGQVLGGSLSAKVPIAITSATGWAVVTRTLDKPTDLTTYAAAVVKAKSLATGKSTAALQLRVSDGTTTFISTDGVPLSTEAKPVTFAMDARHLTRAEGHAPLSDVLKAVTSIGFRICNASGATATKEMVDFDDFAVQATAEQ